MRKRLTPSAIIPEDLYVERTGDAQLRAIIESMGRPGYVLVARQMGKTNLLLHAKKILETKADIFVYIDLSNRFTSDRECFRSIIDKILDTNSEKLQNCQRSILEDRSKSQLASHREHSKELRRILAAISGKLIIILDEIDSLTAADYSDKIFAHVRSIYFERVNFREFERLSYIISGVAEPDDIIKDKSISPFNIGEKILLGDFSYAEYSNFLVKADLTWDESIKDRVFYWANGHPRLTWEICSEIEDATLANNEIDVTTVDHVVNQLYLLKFNRAPIDHMRTLVEGDKELQEALLSLLQQDQESISDKVKSRLYLSGILGSDYEYGSVKIKNRIIENCLSEKWLQQLEKNIIHTIVDADEYFLKKEYQKAADSYKKVLLDPSVNQSVVPQTKYQLALCYYHLYRYAECVTCMVDNLYDKAGARNIYFSQVYILGHCYLRLGDGGKALHYFNEILADNYLDFYYEALLNKARILYELDATSHYEELTELNRKVIEDFDEQKKVAPVTITAALHNAGEYIRSKDPDQAYNYYLRAYEIAEEGFKVIPLISAILIRPETTLENLEKILAVLSTGSVHINKTHLTKDLELSIASLADLVNIILKAELYKEADSLFSHIKEHCLSDTHTFAGVLFAVAMQLSFTNQEGCQYLLGAILSLDKVDSYPKDVFLTNRLLAFFSTFTDDSAAANAYFKGFQNYTDSIDAIDVHIFEKAILFYIKADMYEKAFKYCELMLGLTGSSPINGSLDLLYILYLKYVTSGQDHSKQAAIELKDYMVKFDELEIKPSRYAPEFLATIKADLDGTLALFEPVKQVIRGQRKYGRNELVTVEFEDGRTFIKKYKHVVDSIRNGMCKIVES